MKYLLLFFVFLVASCASPCEKHAFDRDTGVHKRDSTLSCDLMINGVCEYYSRSESFRPTYNELKP